MAPNVNAFRQWFGNLPIPWLVGGPNGQAEAGTWPAYMDTLAGRLDAARKVAFPDYAPADALAHLGADRGLIQGSNESNASFQARLKDVWGQRSRGGTAAGVLEQLWYFGLTGAYWVQQNGVYYTYGVNTLTPGQDPTLLLTSGNLSVTTSALTDSVSGRTIPAGTPWWTVDTRTDITNRFAIVMGSWPFSALAFAYFNGTDNATVTWPFTFASSTYSVIVGVPSDSVTLTNDSTAQTTTQTVIRASAAWTGRVPVIGFVSGVNPLNTFSSASLGQLKSIIATFRPNSICEGVFATLSGRVWGWPTTVAWGDGGTWGGSVSQILGVF